VTAKEGILVLGVPRSGTTLVRRILNAHPAIHCPPETSLFGAAGRFLQEESFAGGVSTGVTSGLAFSGIQPDEVLERLRSMIFEILERLASAQGKPRWAEKTAFDIFHLDAIEKLCADRCRFVCVIRHGLDVVCSIRELCDRMDRYPGELHSYVCRYPRPYEAFAWAWHDANRRLKQFVDAHTDRCFVLRYEQLLESPSVVLTELFHFLGEPADVATLLEGLSVRDPNPGLGDWKTYQRKGLDPASVRRWSALDPDTVRLLGPVVNPVLTEFGYPAVSEPPATAERTARRRLQLGLVATQLR
jgi:hypothetical protein